jgi:hypothetical protein
MVLRHRIVVALLTAAALVFAQLAVASHACAAASSPQPHAMMADCGEAPAADTSLCASHCDYGNVSLDTAKVPLPPAQLMDSGWRIPVLPVAASRGAERIAATAAPSPLLLLARFTVLRI